MILYDLLCRTGGHKFEGWFGSAADFDAQKARGLLSCPVCGAVDVDKALSAPRLTRKGNQLPAAPAAAPAAASGGQAVSAPAELPPVVREMLAKVAEAQSEMLKKSEWVGDRFGEEARAIHYGEKDARMIHGSTTPAEASALREEGVPVAPLLVPFVPPELKN